MRKSIYRCVLAFILGAASVSTEAQTDLVEKRKLQIRSAARPICEAVAAPILRTPSPGNLIESGHVTTNAVCSCVDVQVDADEKLTKILKSSTEEFQVVANNKRFQAYVALRYTAETMYCVSREFSSALQSVTLDQ